MNAHPPSARPSFGDALSIIADHSPLMTPRRTFLADALGGCLAETVHAEAYSPRFQASAMDGYALLASSTQGASDSHPIDLPIATAIFAGDVPTQVDGTHAHPISTGAMLPPGLDAVITRETAIPTPDGSHRLRFPAPVREGLNVRDRGEDARMGEEVAVAGQAVTPAAIGALTSYGVGTVLVRSAPSITILPTGSELGAEHTPDLRPTHIFDSNGPMIAAFARQLGLSVNRVAPVDDDRSSLRNAFDDLLAAPASTLILSTGGVSVGDRDLIRAMLLDRGAVIHFHGVAMRPGKPVLFATLPNGKLYFGLPGNPVSALLGFRFFVLAAIRAMIGLPSEQGERVDFDYPGRSGTTWDNRGPAGERADRSMSKPCEVAIPR